MKTEQKITDVITRVENKYILKKNKLPVIIGDIISFSYLISEGNKERTQRIEGVIISKKHGGINETITIRRLVENFFVEQIIFLNSPKILKIDIKQHSLVRRAKLYFLRKTKGKDGKLIQKI
jgi:large subunit ribosomal protein L19